MPLSSITIMTDMSDRSMSQTVVQTLQNTIAVQHTKFVIVLLKQSMKRYKQIFISKTISSV